MKSSIGSKEWCNNPNNICVGSSINTGIQTTVPYNPPTLLSSNNNNNTATYQPQPPLVSSSLFGSSSGGYVGVAESHSMNNQHGGIHAGIGIHGKYVEPKPLPIQSVQTVAINTPQPVVQKQVLIPKPVITVAKIEPIVTKHIPCPPVPITNAEIKAKPIAEDIAATQKKGHEKIFKLENVVVTHEVMYELSNALMHVSFDLDVMSFKNTKILNGGVFGIFTNMTYGTFHNVVYLDISNTDSSNTVAFYMSKYLVTGKMSATKYVNLSGNKITDSGANFIAEAMKTGNFKLEQLNLSGNKITDNGVNKIAEALKTGKVNTLNHLDMSGNHITEKGEDFFVKALNDPIVHRLAILIDDLSKNLRIQSGIKEDVVAELQRILSSAKDRGVDVDNLVVDTSFFTWVKNIKGSVKVATKGFIKCKWIDDPIGDHVKADLCDKLPDKIGKPLKKIIDVEGTVSCFIYAYDKGKTSEFGAQMAVTDLHVIGEDYVPENIE